MGPIDPILLRPDLDSNKRLSLNETHAKQLEAQLQQITELFEQQMRARGFDPEQADNVALPTGLARLYLERQKILEQLEEIEGRTNNEGS